MTTTATHNNPRARKLAALIAAWDWIGTYEADDTPARRQGDYAATITLENAFEHVGTASKVKRTYPGFPDDIVDAYALVRRMARAMQRADGAAR